MVIESKMTKPSSLERPEFGLSGQLPVIG